MSEPVESSTPGGPVPEDGIAERLRQLRQQLGLSQSQFHQRTKESDPEGKGISRTVLVGYESGKFKPGARELRVLCETFRVSASWLLLGDRSEGDDDLDAASSILLGGLGKPGLDVVFGLALALACLKDHERAAIASLVHGIASSRRSFPAASEIRDLATWMADDAAYRLQQLTGETNLESLIRKADGPEKIEILSEHYIKALKARGRTE